MLLDSASKTPTKDTNVTRTFWRYTIPAVVAMMVNGLYQIVDGIFIGHYLGAQGLAAVNLAWPIIGIIIGFGVLIGMGSGSLLSIYRGAGDNTDVQQLMGTSFWLIAILTVVAMTVLVLFGPTLLELQGASGELLHSSLAYLQVLNWGAGVTIAAGALPLLLRNNGKPEMATALLIVGALGNIVLDYFMIVEMQWQLPGAALATLISQGIVALAALYFLLTSSEENKPKGAFNQPLALEILKQGAAGLVMFLYFGFIVALHNKQLLIFASEVEVAAFAVVGYLGVIYYFIAEGVANGVQPPISYYYGAGLYQRIHTMFKLALKVSLGFGVMMVTMFYLFPKDVLGLFSEDFALLNAAERGLQLHLSTLFLDGFIFLTSMYFVAVGKGGKALVISLGNMLVQLPFLYLLPFWFGVDGVWLAVPISNITLTVIIIPLLWRDLYQLKHAGMEATSGDKQCA